LEASLGEQLATTIVTYEEQTRGWLSHLSKARKLAEQVERYHKLFKHLRNYCSITVLEFDNDAAFVFQRLRSGLRLGTMDLKIAAIVLRHQAKLLTRNTVDFAKVPGLQFDDWTI